MNPIAYRELVLNFPANQMQFLTFIRQNFPDFNIFLIIDNTLRIQKDEFELDFHFIQTPNGLVIQFEVEAHLAFKYEEYLSRDQIASNLYAYPKKDPFDLLSLEMPYETQNQLKIFHNLIGLILDQHIDKYNQFIQDVRQEMLINNLRIIGTTSIISASIFILFLDFLKEKNLDDILYLICLHLLLIFTWGKVSKKMYFKNNNLI